MGLFFRPRRPLLRLAAGAATTTVAYQAGKRRVQPDEINDPAGTGDAAPRASPPPIAPAPVPVVLTAELERLAKLHASGALTDVEFAAAKAQLLGL
jgi:hypothetical protein